MFDFDSILREKDTSELQQKIRDNTLIPPAAEVAKSILEERGATIPEPASEDELESKYAQARKKSTLAFLAFVAWLALAFADDLFNPSSKMELIGSFLPVAVMLGWYRKG